MLNVDADSRGLKQGLRICISIKMPGDIELDDPLFKGRKVLSTLVLVESTSREAQEFSR